MATTAHAHEGAPPGGGLRSRLARAWGEFVGPGATPVDHALTAAGTVVGAVAAPLLARRRGADRARTTAASLLAADLVGGVYVNNTRACARWYERPGLDGAPRDTEHVAFAALHVHPAAVAWIDRGSPRRVPGPWWAAAHYAYLMGATAAIRRFPGGRRPLGVVLTAGGLALDGVLGPSPRVPWFAWAYYPKLLAGHAAASWWSDDDLAAEDPR